jgi:hypothetical protein
MGKAMKRKLMLTAAGVVFVLAAASRVTAHHAFSAEFDADRPVKLKGTVVKLEWVNPHAWIHIEVPKDGGGTEEWMIEGGTPNTLIRRGLTKDALPIGTEVIVDGFQAKDRSTRANGRDITLADGRKLFLGSENSGAPARPEGTAAPTK